MNVTLQYRLSEQGRKAALLAGRQATAEVNESVQVEDLEPLADVLSVTAQGEAVLSAMVYEHRPGGGHKSFWGGIDSVIVDQGTELVLDAPPADAHELAQRVRVAAASILAMKAENDRIVAEERERKAAARRKAEEERVAAHSQFMADPSKRGCFWDSGQRISIGASGTEPFDSRVPAHAEALRRQQADEAARQAAMEERERQRREWTLSFLAAHADENARGRYEAGLLPEPELMDRVSEVTFAPLAKFASYVKLTTEDVPCSCDGYDEDDCAISYSSREATTATAEEWEALRRVREACAADETLASATVGLRLHEAERDRCEESATRSGILVIAQAGPFSVRREFAAE